MAKGERKSVFRVYAGSVCDDVNPFNNIAGRDQASEESANLSLALLSSQQAVRRPRRRECAKVWTCTVFLSRLTTTPQ